MITNISLTSVWVKDIEESKRFYVDVLGFAEGDDIQLGDDFRWCTVFHPTQPELHVHLTTPSKPLSESPGDQYIMSNDYVMAQVLTYRGECCAGRLFSPPSSFPSTHPRRAAFLAR